MRAREKKHHTGLFVTLGVVLVVTILCVSINIREITISGNYRYGDVELVELIFPEKISYNSLYCFVCDKMGKHVQIPFVEDYKVDFHSPMNVEIIVHEKSIVGYVSYMSSYLYFDKDGIVVESANRKLEGIPLIEGLHFGQIVLHKELPVPNKKVFDAILNLTQVLAGHHIEADSISFDEHNTPKINLDGIEVILGDDDYLDSKISVLSDMLPQLEGLSGTLYLNTYDPTGNHQMYTFKKK